MICRAVIDTNVLVSSLLSRYADAATVQVVRHVLVGNVIPVYSDDIIFEYRQVLQRKKFKFPAQATMSLLTAIEQYGIKVVPALTNTVLPDRKDVPFYDAYRMGNAQGWYLVTGNIRHFPQEPRIVIPRDFITFLT